MLNKEVSEESPTTEQVSNEATTSMEQVFTEQMEKHSEKGKEEQQTISSDLSQHATETSPWQRAEKYRQLYKEMKTTRRRVVIPYQPSHNVIIHSYYPPNVYLKYHFVINLNTTDVPPLPVIVPSSSVLKREEPSYESTTIEGYKPIKRSRTKPSHDPEKEAGVSSLQREVGVRVYNNDQYNACCENEKVLQAKLHNAKDEISHLEKQIAETEKKLSSDQVVNCVQYKHQTRHNSLVSNLHKRIETNALKKTDHQCFFIFHSVCLRYGITINYSQTKETRERNANTNAVQVIWNAYSIEDLIMQEKQPFLNDYRMKIFTPLVQHWDSKSTLWSTNRLIMDSLN